MKTTPNSRAGTAAAALATVLLLAGCGTQDGTDPQPTETESVTATADPHASQDEVAEQVIDYYRQENDLRDENGMLGEDARKIATYNWIDNRNKDMERLLGGGRTLEIVETTTTDYQVLDFNGTGSGDDPWTITINACGEDRWDYREEDGTVLLDPDDVQQGAEKITARYDGPNDVWKLTEFEKGDPSLCDHASTDDSTTTTEES